MRPRAKRILAGYGIFLVAVTAVSVTMNITMVLSWRFVPRSIAFAVIAALAPCVYFAARPFWTRIDDRQREAGMISWYWGGLCGLVFGVASAGVIAGPPSGHLLPEFVKGALYMMISQVVGTAIAGLIRWRANRSHGE